MDEYNTPATTAPEQKKFEPRKQRREKAEAVKLFNKLLFSFTKLEAENTTEADGFLQIGQDVYAYADKINNHWRTFCNHVRLNNKKKLSFKLDALEKALNQHIDRHKNQVWTRHLKEVLNNQHGIDMPISAAGTYTDLSKKPKTVADTIYQNLKIMYKIEIPDIRFTTEIPENIGEMTSEQFIFFAELLLKLYSNKIEVYDLKTAMAMKFLGVKYSEKEYTGLSGDARSKISENVHGITGLFDYFFVEKEGDLQVNTEFTRNMIPILKIKHHPCLKGPADALTDISFLEYKDANAAYRSYLENQDEDNLNEMIAILYRPYIIPFLSEKFRDSYPALSHKRKYKPEAVRRRKSRIAKLPLPVRFAIFLNYMATEDYLRTGKLQMDGVEINLKLLYDTTLKEKQLQKKNKYEENTGLAGIALALASSGIFGTVAAVYEQNLYDVLLLLYKQRVEYLNQLENLKS